MGIDKAIELIPDIIISDVMMPQKTGFEVTSTLKTDERTSHIPIVLLTAKADIASKLSGLKKGADVYLAKPFHQEELLIQLQNLLQIRQKLQARYQS
ncbi:MAG: response regulator [Bacteroidota bacterium]